jgi:hypothetical protein
VWCDVVCWQSRQRRAATHLTPQQVQVIVVLHLALAAGIGVGVAFDAWRVDLHPEDVHIVVG